MKNPATKDNSYRCPACGEMVDNHDLDAIRFHHQHVLHPPPDRYVMLPFVVPGVATNERKPRENTAHTKTGGDRPSTHRILPYTRFGKSHEATLTVPSVFTGNDRKSH